ncbi:MAG: glycine/sarcosine/betaine reductase selenoprotein B family protein [Bacillota bacterium]|jgi:D-proline reductase (dithiol) PrdB
MINGMEVLEKEGPQYERRYKRFQSWYESVFQWHDNFVFTPNKNINWAETKKPMSEWKVGLVSSCGVHLRSQKPFETDATEGDWSYREIPADTDPKDLMITDSHYDHSDADSDINCMYPIVSLRELKKEGVIGSLANTLYGFMGFVPIPKYLIADTAPQVAKKLVDEKVDVVLLTPGCAVCHQTLGIIQNMIEGMGIPTITTTLKPELTEQIHVPRAAYLKFPYGYAAGPANQLDEQKTIVKEILSLIPEIQEPGTIVKLPYRWQGRVE